MKTFSQFLNDAYLIEEGVPGDYEEYMRSGKSGTTKNLAKMSQADFDARFGNNSRMQLARDIGIEQSNRPAGKRKSSKSVAELKAEIDAREAAAKARKAGRQPSGAAADPTKKFNPKTTTLPSPALPAGRTTPRPQLSPGKPGGTLARTVGVVNPQSPSKDMMKGALDAAKKAKASQKALPSGTSSAAKEAEKAAAKAATKTAGKGILKGLGRVVGPASAVLDVADERSKGSGWLRSLAKGAVVAAGGAAGGAGGSVAGPVGTVAGAVGGSMAASKAFDTVAGANAVERKAIATANRKSQSGGEIKGIGGPTSFSQKKPGGAAFMSTGSGPQRKTVELAKTSVVTDPKTGKQEVGNLAFKGGQAVYKRADTKSLAQTSSNPFERIGRTIAAGAYKDNDAKLAAAKLATARASDATRNQKLGVKLKPGG